MVGDKLNVLWVSNAAAPYRKPVWSHLGRRTALTVGLLDSPEHIAADGRRGEDWVADSQPDVRYLVLKTWRRRYEESAFHILRRLPQLGSARDHALVLCGWESPAYWQLLASAKLRGVRCVGFYESTLDTNRFTSGPVAFARRKFFKALDAVVVPGVAARHAVASFGVQPERIFEGFNAVDVEAFHRAVALRHDPHRGHRFLYVGQLIARKNVGALIDAFALARNDDDTLTIVGVGDAEAQLRQVAADREVEDAVAFIGHITNDTIPEIMAKADTLALVSRTEVWGLVVNEALAAGLHVVVSRSCGVTPSVASMRGVFTTESDPHAIADALRASRDSWRGPIVHPQIIEYTPERFADVFADALSVAD